MTEANEVSFYADVDESTAHIYQTDATVVAFRFGEQGYYPIYTRLKAAELNDKRGITPEIMEAAQIGSMFGWTAPGAKPAWDYAMKVLKEREPVSAGMADLHAAIRADTEQAIHEDFDTPSWEVPTR